MDLSLASTPSSTTSNFNYYVVVTQLSQPVTCFSTLNVKGNSRFLNKATCYSSLNVSGHGYGRFLSNVFCMPVSNLNINGALQCNSQSFDSNTTLLSSVSGFSTFNNDVSLL